MKERERIIQEIEGFKTNYKSQVIVSALNQVIRGLKGEKKRYSSVSSLEERKRALEFLLSSDAITAEGKKQFQKELKELRKAEVLEEKHER